MAHFRIMNASQSSIHKFESLKRKLYNCNASIYFNRQCIRQNLTPAYAKIKIPNTSPACRRTQQRVTNLQLKDGIKSPVLLKTEAEHTNIPPTPNTS